MKILFYLPLNNRCRNIESQALEFGKNKHDIFLLTHHQPHGAEHYFFENNGFVSDSYVAISPIKGLAIIKYILHFIRFCKKNKIDIVYAHVDAANLIAVLAQYFVPAKIVVGRHHADALWLLKDYRNYFLSKLIYKLAPTIEVVSSNAKKWMIEKEGILARKIHVIPISYNWTLFPATPTGAVEEIRIRFGGKLLLSTAGRFLPIKRIDQVIELVAALRNRRMDVQLLILGDGVQREQLIQLVKKRDLESSVHFLGFIDNVLPYLAASDLYVHFSESEASCVSVKEAGLVNTPVMVCRQVGDFEEYLVDNETAFFVRKANAVEDGILMIERIVNDMDVLKSVGNKLKTKVLDYFSILNVMPIYNRLNKSIEGT